jgi:hypothetical protein
MKEYQQKVAYITDESYLEYDTGMRVILNQKRESMESF